MSTTYRPTAPDRYVMATTALHKLGDISRDEPSLAVIYGETDTDLVGEWVTGFGYIDVRFPKGSTRPLTVEEWQRYNGRRLSTGGVLRIEHP